jgi:hypothetical protein
MKLALMLGGMIAGRQAGGAGQLLTQGSKLLSQSPELAQLTDQVRGRLLEAGKGAALAVAARQVESLTERVGQRVESLGGVGVPQRGKRLREEPEDTDEDEYAEPEDEEPEDSEPDEARSDGSAGRNASGRTSTRSSGSASTGGGAATSTARRATGTAHRTPSRTTAKRSSGQRSPRQTRTRRDSGND